MVQDILQCLSTKNGPSGARRPQGWWAPFQVHIEIYSKSEIKKVKIQKFKLPRSGGGAYSGVTNTHIHKKNYQDKRNFFT